MWIDVGSLISGHIPDKNGNVLPDDLSAGTYEIRQPGHGGIGSLYEGKVVYDKTYGHATYGCASCCAYKGAFTFVYNPLGIPDDGTAPQEVKAYDTCSGMYLYPTDDFYDSWNTTNPSIATVDANGVHTGVAIGSTTTHAQAQEQLWYRWNDCPIQTVGPIGNDNVNAVPVNFQQVSTSDLGSGDLFFGYTWQSSSGKLSDLSNCMVGEIVTYPGPNPYPWPAPFPANSPDNPTVTNEPGADGEFTDDNNLEPAMTFVKPYFQNSFTATQYFRYSCNGGQYVNLMGPLSLVRTVSKDSNGAWEFTVTKPTNGSAKIDPLQ
jgi:hypothetical protein